MRKDIHKYLFAKYMSSSAELRGQKLRNSKAFGAIERVGNKMVQPMTLFGILCLIVVLLSTIGSLCGWSDWHGQYCDHRRLQSPEQRWYFLHAQ